MGSRLKEDEKNEKAIRALLRKTPNRRCINCNSLGPQYVCLNFWTFVCTQCSGIHREFTHRVKSVSMSKFTSQEVANLEAGGNERGREMFFKDWDPQRQPLPDSNNVDRLREFIKMVYVEKRFSGERPLPRSRGGEREEMYDNRRTDPRQNPRAESRSPPYEDRYDDRGRRSNAGYDDRRWDDRGRFDERRSPARFDEKRSPARFESDRNRYDRSYNDTRRYDERPRYEPRDRYSYEDRHNEGPDRRYEDRFANEKGTRGYGGSSPPPIRPVKEILGEDVPPLRVENHGSQTNGGRDIDKNQSSQKEGQGPRFGSSSSFGSVDGNVPAAAPAVKREEPTSLIDFSAESVPPAVKEQIDPFGLTAAVQPVATDSTGWATFEPAVPAPSSAAVAQAPAISSVEDVLGSFSNATNVVNGNSQWAAQWAAPGGAPAGTASANSWSTLGGSSLPATSSQPWNAFSTTASEANSIPVSQGLMVHDSQISSSSSGAAAQVVQAQPSGRAPLPENIFSASVSSSPFTGGQAFGAHYPPMAGLGLTPQGSYNQPQKSSNPFDLPGDSGPNQMTGEFPSLSSMQSALPALGMGPRPVPGLGAYGPQWSHANSLTSPQALYSSGFSAGQTKTMAPPQAFYPSGSGSFFAPQSQNVLPQAMQGSLGPLGANTQGIYPSAPNPKQGSESFFSAPSFQSLPSQKSFGGADSMFTPQARADSMFTPQAPGQFPYQNQLGPGAAANFTSTDSFMAGPAGQQRLVSHSSLGSLSNIPGGDSLFPSQAAIPGQRLLSHGSLGSLNSLTATDTHFPVQAPSQFPTHPVGNPFG